MNINIKTTFLAVLLAGSLIAGIWLLVKQQNPSPNSYSRCQKQEMTYYYLDQCERCQKVKNEGTISKIEQLGVKVKQINAAIGSILHQFEEVPTFVIDEMVYSGYKTIDELKELLGCGKENNQKTSLFFSDLSFLGEKGKIVFLENGEITIDAQQFDDNQARFYNVNMPNNKLIYFFVVKDKNGIYRAAANACAVCFKTYKGFRQEGNEIVCNNCGNRYPIEKIATEKGGCNPGPINPNLEIKNGKIIIKQSDLEQVAELF